MLCQITNEYCDKDCDSCDIAEAFESAHIDYDDIQSEEPEPEVSYK